MAGGDQFTVKTSTLRTAAGALGDRADDAGKVVQAAQKADVDTKSWGLLGLSLGLYEGYTSARNTADRSIGEVKNFLTTAQGAVQDSAKSYDDADASSSKMFSAIMQELAVTSGDVVAAGHKAYSSAKDLKDDLSDGNYLAAGKDAFDIGGLVGDVSKFASGSQGNILGDPLNELISAGLDFLIDLIAPLKEALNLVTGDAEGLSDKADDWAEVAQSLRELGPQAVSDAKATSGDWTGAAGDAFRGRIDRFNTGVSSVAGQADHVADVLRVSSTLMDAAQSIIKGIISSWVEYAIITEAAAAASAAFTFGASEAAGQAAVAGEASVACGRGAETVSQTSSLLERVASSLKDLEGTFGQLGRALEEDAASLRQAEGALRSASDSFAQRSAEEAQKALNEGIKDSIKDAGEDAAIGLGDDTIKGGQAQSKDGHESQQQIDGDLSLPNA